MGKETIICVDDEKLVLDTLRDQIWANLGSEIKIELAQSAEEAMSIVNTLSDQAAVVIADHLMPGMKGDDFLAEVHSIWPHTRKILLTGQIDVASVGNAVNRASLYRFISKPWDTQDLVLTLKEAIRSFQMEKLLAQKHKELEASEKLYRNIVESSSDMIFSLDRESIILSMNRAVQTHLGYKPQDLIGKSFWTLWKNTNSNDFPDREMNLRRAKLEVMFLMAGNKSTSFRSELITRFGEPVEMQLKLESAQAEGGIAIYAKAASLDEDEVLRACIRESQVYRIGNLITKVDQICRRLTAVLRKYTDEDTAVKIELGLREVLINSIEHGNLEIDFATKSRLQDEESFFDFLIQRQNKPEFADRFVEIEYLLEPTKVEFRITDQGAGFNHSTLEIDQPVESERLLGHGRGLKIVRALFDGVEFNEKGNSVLLKKYF